jgi:hypothetical protein
MPPLLTAVSAKADISICGVPHLPIAIPKGNYSPNKRRRRGRRPPWVGDQYQWMDGLLTFGCQLSRESVRRTDARYILILKPISYPAVNYTDVLPSHPVNPKSKALTPEFLRTWEVVQ